MTSILLILSKKLLLAGVHADIFYQMECSHCIDLTRCSLCPSESSALLSNLENRAKRFFSLKNSAKKVVWTESLEAFFHVWTNSLARKRKKLGIKKHTQHFDLMTAMPCQEV